MPELRRDTIIGRWVIIAKERGKRPYDFVIEKDRTKGGFCPLCPGNEHTTPPEVLSYGRPGHSPNGPGWTLRVVPNKFPALVIEGDLDKRGEGIYDKMNGIGAHEVIIDTPRHDETMPMMSHEQLIQSFWAYRDRIVDLAKDSRFRYIIVFKNFGRAAGASLEHSHSQLIALPIVPHRIQEEIQSSLHYYEYKERCIFCDIIRQEKSQDIRIACENNDFITICPFAPRSPFEMWLMPKKHQSSYVSMDDNQFRSLTELFLETMRRLDKALPGVPYNYMLHTAPLRSPFLEHYHWHIEIMPKVTTVAGFEWGTGFYINPTPPEESAQFLREINLD
ncbi:MAG: galactose-1-phosphate uridylyltransferase [Deltaproteobacteria bacterium]|nr:galactose-1-phosphate uridylyltransferase [Deltaproteobacteria bacterium]PXF55326.1 MAG: galactose-1-phosphate uridylyltransferase [Deltaproteobacteria bacterium]